MNGKTLVLNTWKTKTLASLLAVIAAVAIPQLVHMVGAVSGLGTSLGETLLPMHFAILVLGLLAGPVAGVAGAISPLLSFALSGMPSVVMLPFMMIELAGYGIAAGLVANAKMPVFVKLVIAQLAGRALRSIAVLIAFYGFGAGLPVASIWSSIVVGLPGILLQWAIIPLLMFWIYKKAQKDE